MNNAIKAWVLQVTFETHVGCYRWLHRWAELYNNPLFAAPINVNRENTVNLDAQLGFEPGVSIIKAHDRCLVQEWL